jgi:DNA-binding NarL/FixJ family response regulator
MGVRSILNHTSDICLTGEASDGIRVLELIKELEPDVLLLDIEMPGMTGIEVARTLQEEGIDIPILIYSAYADKSLVAGVLENGAAGYLTKDEVPEMLLTALRRMATGDRGLVSRHIADRLSLWYEDQPETNITVHPIS